MSIKGQVLIKAMQEHPMLHVSLLVSQLTAKDINRRFCSENGLNPRAVYQYQAMLRIKSRRKSFVCTKAQGPKRLINPLAKPCPLRKKMTVGKPEEPKSCRKSFKATGKPGPKISKVFSRPCPLSKKVAVVRPASPPPEVKVEPEELSGSQDDEGGLPCGEDDPQHLVECKSEAEDDAIQQPTGQSSQGLPQEGPDHLDHYTQKVKWMLLRPLQADSCPSSSAEPSAPAGANGSLATSNTPVTSARKIKGKTARNTKIRKKTSKASAASDISDVTGTYPTVADNIMDVDKSPEDFCEVKMEVQEELSCSECSFKCYHHEILTKHVNDTHRCNYKGVIKCGLSLKKLGLIKLTTFTKKISRAPDDVPGDQDLPQSPPDSEGGEEEKDHEGYEEENEGYKEENTEGDDDEMNGVDDEEQDCIKDELDKLQGEEVQSDRKEHIHVKRRLKEQEKIVAKYKRKEILDDGMFDPNTVLPDSSPEVKSSVTASERPLESSKPTDNEELKADQNASVSAMLSRQSLPWPDEVAVDRLVWKAGQRQCVYCTHVARSGAMLLAHYTQVHECSKLYQCSRCSFATNYKNCLKNHIAWRHSNCKPHACSLCNYRTAVKHQLRQHIRVTHATDKKHECPHCEFVTQYKGALNDHITGQHTKERKYKCSLCPYASIRGDQVRKHFATRHGIPRPKKEGPLRKCPLCPYTAYTQGSIYQHNLRYHEVVMHKCPMCPYESCEKARLKRHIACRHCDERPFKCTQCPYAAKLKDRLVVHVQNQHLERPLHTCPLCDYGARARFKCRVHFIAKHPDHNVEEYFPSKEHWQQNADQPHEPSDE
ncbi:hypothetical protein HAZT_HAZT010544 [Hyalella azteca]|uniref:C2H2-type domain-containing protein n=1 Tax=Hyalella azteca TaxID=294128 RepID=A0A6A0GTI1_HYAAZ|nr:hypothetical protein HAZT_HAZT010544 [Hyalella azteca]